MKQKIIPVVDETRRRLLKTGIAASAALSVGLPLSAGAAEAAKKVEGELVWKKGVCRFCGTGCGLQVGVKDGQVVATTGDPHCDVNHGLLCMKGYYNSKILYSQDRLKTPWMRMKDGRFDKTGELTPVSWKVAMDEMERQFRRVYKAKGPAGVALVPSGQSTIPEAYVASKLWKGGFRSNNLDPNARLCMASAVVGFYQVFGIDEPANVYADLETADNILFWGNNLAEAHPVLWGRVVNHLKTSKARLINISTYTNLSSELADETILIKPNSDLAVFNYLIREIIKRGKVDKKFVEENCVFAAGVTDIGFGLRETDEFAYPAELDIQKKQHAITLTKDEAIAMGLKAGQVVEQKNTKTPGKHWLIDFEEFKKGVEPYTLDFVARIAQGDAEESESEFKRKLAKLADVVCEDKNLLSLWCMGFNQHQRGVWVNELCYSMHLLLGRHGAPGNGAFSLTGQPSACGSAREVGIFSHRLPSDMLVANPKHRERTEKLWRLAPSTLNPKVGADVLAIMRGLEDKSINFLWTQSVNIFQSAPDNTHWARAARDPENFVVVSDVYPTYSGKLADLILPAAFHFEKWGLFGNGERRTQGWEQLVRPVGEARTDVWAMLELSRRFKVRDVYGEQPLKGVEGDKLPDVLEGMRKLGYNEDTTLFDVLFAPNEKRQAVWPDPLYKDGINATTEALGMPYFVEKALFNEYREFTLGHGHDLADFDTYMNPDVHGLVWPYVDGKQTYWRFNPEYDPYAKEGDRFYGPLQKELPRGDLHGVTNPEKVSLKGKAKIFFRPWQEPAEKPDANYDLWLCTGRILEHWHTGSMTLRVPQLKYAAAKAYLYMNPKDAADRGLKRGDLAEVTSRHGTCRAYVETEFRNLMPRGATWLAFFDEKAMANAVTSQITDPLSKEPDFKKTAVKVKKAA